MYVYMYAFILVIFIFNMKEEIQMFQQMSEESFLLYFLFCFVLFAVFHRNATNYLEEVVGKKKVILCIYQY